MHPFTSATAAYLSYGGLIAGVTPLGPVVVAIVAFLIVLAVVGPRILQQFVIPLVALVSSGEAGRRALRMQEMRAGVDTPRRGKKARKKRAGRPRGS